MRKSKTYISVVKRLLLNSVYPFFQISRTNAETFVGDAKIAAHGRQCECCLEMNWKLDGDLEAWKSIFPIVDKEKAVLVYRIAPMGDKKLKYHGRNWRVAHDYECAELYRAYWANHPKRGELRDICTQS